MQYHFEVHKEEAGYWAECLELEGCVTEGESLFELKTHAKEALDLYLDEPETSVLSAALPDDAHQGRENVMEVPVEPGIALAVLLRRYREEHRCTQKEMCERLGMKNLYSYQRLERRSNPSLETLRKLKKIFPDLSVDYLLQE